MGIEYESGVRCGRLRDGNEVIGCSDGDRCSMWWGRRESRYGE